MKNVHFGSAGVERVVPFQYKRKTWYAEDHCFCGWMVSDPNRMGVFDDHPAFKYFIKNVLPTIKKPMIVKVQLPIASNVSMQAVLIYDKERDVMFTGKCPDDVKAAMRGRPKAFFEAELKEVRADEYEIVLGNEAPWQNW